MADRSSDLSHRGRTRSTKLGDFALTVLPLLQVLQDLLGLGFGKEFVVRFNAVSRATKSASISEVNLPPHLSPFANAAPLHVIDGGHD